MDTPKPVLILCDSRGFGLQEKINTTNPHTFVVRSVSSAGLVMAATNFLSTIIEMKPEYVIIAAGICEVTLKNTTTKKYTVRCTEVEEAVQLYVDAMNEAKSLIQDVSQGTRVIFNPVTGVDLEDYNSKNRKGLEGPALEEYHNNKCIHPMQDTLNKTVIAINQKIAKVNYENKVATPWSATLVHKHEKGNKYYHHYQYLADGCHLLDECKLFWAEKFQKAVTKSMELKSRE